MAKPKTKPETKKGAGLSHTLKDNRLFIPGHGTVEKTDFNAEHFAALEKLDGAVEKHCVPVEPVEMEEGEETE